MLNIQYFTYIMETKKPDFMKTAIAMPIIYNKFNSLRVILHLKQPSTKQIPWSIIKLFY